jgi:hypothetical protein
MSFREKTAWAMGAVLIAAGVWYFQRVIGLSDALGETAAPNMRFVIGYIILVILASILVNVIIASAAGKEAEAPADERERAILDKAGIGRAMSWPWAPSQASGISAGCMTATSCSTSSSAR